MEQSETLLACPFCGSAAEYGESEDGGHFIQCTGAMCMASSKLIYPEKTDPHPLLKEAWNERAGAGRAWRNNGGKQLCSSAWLDALSESVESAERIKVALLEVDDRELAEDALLLQENLKALRRQMESASNVVLSDGGEKAKPKE